MKKLKVNFCSKCGKQNILVEGEGEIISCTKEKYSSDNQ